MINKNKIIKRTNVLDAPHPMLITFGMGVSISMALIAGLSMLVGDHSQVAYAVRKFEEW